MWYCTVKIALNESSPTMRHVGVVHGGHTGQVAEVCVGVDLRQLIITQQVLPIKVCHVLLRLVGQAGTAALVWAHDLCIAERSPRLEIIL